MLQYLLKRLLIFVPTFFVISLMIFGLSKMAPGDPVEIALKGAGAATGAGMAELAKGEEDYRKKAEELGLDRPVFYFSLTSAAYPADLYKIQKQQHRELVARLIDQYGNAQEVLAYYELLRRLEFALAEAKVSAEKSDDKTFTRQTITKLYLEYKDQDIRYKLDTLKLLFQGDAGFATAKPVLDSLDQAYEQIKAKASTYKLYIPSIHWNGWTNQYHTWMFGDYPLMGLDSTPYKQVETLFQQRAKLNQAQDSLKRLLAAEEYQRNLAQQFIGLSNDSFKLLAQQNSSWVQERGLNLETMPRPQMDSLIKGFFAQKEQAVLALQKTIETDKQTIVNISQSIEAQAKELKTYASKGLLRGDFGKSYVDRKPVSVKIGEALYWTLWMNIVSIFLSYLISIPLGVQSATWKLRNRHTLDSINTAILFILYSIPSFWIATIFIVLFTNPEYGMNWFPAGGAHTLGYDKPGIPFMTYWMDVLHHMVLPVFCITYSSFAYLSRQMRGSMLGVMRQDYIRTARAKGLSEGKVIWKHAFRNSLFPIITLFSSVFPRALSGAVAIEFIFNIPGMGVLVLNSIQSRDWPVVFTVVLFGALLTMIGNLVADVLYAVADPRVTYGNKK
jgi:ABC-type dipeptide/oligopeptide/nickel transport system permease component